LCPCVYQLISRATVSHSSPQTLLAKLASSDFAVTQTRVIIIPEPQALGYQLAKHLEEIILEFYHPSAPALRPLILATVTRTTRPWFIFDQQLLDLEELTASKTFGFTDSQRDGLTSTPKLPHVEVVTYEPWPHPPDTPLFTKLREACSPALTLFEPYIRRARLALCELGPAAADLILLQANESIRSAVAEDQSDLSARDRVVKLLDDEQRQAFKINQPLSPKFERLFDNLKDEQKRCPDDFRAIILVRETHVARVLIHFMNALLPSLKAKGIVAHTDNTDVMPVFHDFSQRKIDILVVAAKNADMEIPKASLVVQFDLLDSHVDYAFSKAHSSNRLVLLAERGKPMHRRITEGLTQSNADLGRWMMTLFANRTLAPQGPLGLPSATQYVPDHDDDDNEKDIVLVNATTGGRLNAHEAVSAIYTYAATLGVAPNVAILELRWLREGNCAGFTCTVYLPGSPAPVVLGPLASSRWQARRAACVQACKNLYQHGALDSRYFRHRRIPGAGALTYSKPTGGASGSTYTRRVPPFWGECARAPASDGVYPVVVECLERGGPERYRPLVLLTRHPLPDLPTTRVYEVPNVREVRVRRAEPLQLDDERRLLLTRYTERTIRTTANKEFTCASGEMLWTVAPLLSGWQSPGAGAALDISGDIDWQGMEASVEDLYLPIQRGTPDELAAYMSDGVVQGRRSEMTRRYFFVRVRRDLTPLSKPADSPREALYENIFEFARSASRDLQTLEDFNQPLIEVERVPHMHNCLTPTQGPSEKGEAPAKYLIPELCAKNTIPASVLRTALLLPSILTRIDEMLLVKELNAVHFNHIIAEDLLHAALTTPSAGFDRDYERLELYGDAFLKYLASLHLFVMSNQNDSEGKLHAARRPLIKNQKLMECALALGLPSFVIGKPFVIKYWAPANFRVVASGGSAEKGKEKEPDAETQAPAKQPTGANQGESTGGKKRNKRKKRADAADGHIQQILSDKALADVVEAILGAAHLSAGRDGALQVAKALGLPVAKNADIWDDFKTQVSLPVSSSVLGMLRQGTVQSVESLIGQKLKKPEFLVLALMHANASSPIGNYERLEFLGDAILDFIVVEHIYRKYSQQPPSVLTLLKSAMVGNSPLAAICVETGLHRHLHQRSQNIQNNIATYITALEEAKKKEYEAANDDLRDRGQYWFNPLSDIVESVMGAIYVSDDLEWMGVQQLFDHILQPFYDKHIRLSTLAVHPSKTLLELVQSQSCHDLQLVKSASSGLTRCDILLHGTPLASETAGNGNLAAKAASLTALNVLEGDPQLIARKCSCRTGTGKNFDQLLSEFKA
ncbi:hypothetical protein HDZ31DRAFT_48445, partial [Schizophyllum fasciatum]